MTATVKQFLAAAASQIGYREGWNGSYWNNDNKFGKWYGMNGVAWCAIFVSWCADQVGVLGELVPRYASCTAGLAWFRQRDESGNWPPRPGDIFILREHAPGRWNADSEGWAPIHTGIVEAWTPDPHGGGYITTIEGNTNTGGSAQGNGVYRLRRRDYESGKSLIYCRPKWAPDGPTQTGGQSAPIHVPPKPAPAKPSKPVVHLSNVRPGKRNEDIGRVNDLMWAYLTRLWNNEPRLKYGYAAEAVTIAVYSILTAREGARKWGVPSSPAWPGAALLSRIGVRANVRNIRLGKSNADCGRYNDALWAYLHKLWMQESRTEFGPAAQAVMVAIYRVLTNLEGAGKWGIPVSKRGEGVWPGPSFITRIGGTPR